eukprot:Skav236787  [mRNA]  locus=scaffold1361:287290:296795:- [translate_table: standard]
MTRWYRGSQVMSIVKRFIPLMDRVLVQKVKSEAAAPVALIGQDSQWHLPARQREAGSQQCEGTGHWTRQNVQGQGNKRDESNEGELIPMNVKVGDTVLIPEYGGVTLNFDKEELQPVALQERSRKGPPVAMAIPKNWLTTMFAELRLPRTSCRSTMCSEMKTSWASSRTG